MSTPVEIRPPEQRTELAGAIRAHGLAWREAYQGILPDEVMERIPTRASEELLDEWYERARGDDRDFLLAVDDEGVVEGYILVRWGEGTKEFVGPNEAGLKEIYVHPDSWGRGIGTALLERALASIPTDLEAIALEMLEGNEIGARFYRSRGFDRVGHSRHEVAGESFETVIYRRSL